MQSILEQSASNAWERISPLLDCAVETLGEKERRAVILRFYEGRDMREVGTALGISEEAAKKRVARALVKMQRFFLKRGVASTTASIPEIISANSIQTAPTALIKSITLVAVAKGATASASTLTLIKGALKLMAWSQTKTVIVAAMIAILAAGTTTVTVKEVHQHNQDAQWDLANADTRTLDKAPHIVRIIPTKFPDDGGWIGNNHRSLGIAEDIQGLIQAAYGGYYGRTIYPAPLPGGKYDFIANLPTGSPEALQNEIQRQFGLVGRLQTLETNVLFLKMSDRELRA